MKFVLILLTLLLIFPVSGKNEVYIDLEKERVAPGESIRISLNVSCDSPSLIEVLITGSGNGEWLYFEEEKTVKFSNTWNFQIPDDWGEGTYLVKVNVIENSTTYEFFRQFKVVKPKILSIEPLEVVYQGRTKLIVNVETPEENETTLCFKFIGLNFRFESEEEVKPEKGVAELILDLRERYDATKDIDYALKPGIYAIEVKLKFKGKLYDSKIATIEVIKPKLSVKVPEELIRGEPIRVEISTNRVNDSLDGAGYYDGIILTLIGENYKATKIVELNEKGEANITLETAGLSEGDYKLYIRDTSLTLRGADLKTFGLLYYDLDPKDPKAKQYYANDDLLVVREIKITKDPNLKSNVIIFFEPTDQSVEEGDLVEYKILLSSAENGLSAYELIVSISNSSVAKIHSISFPEWASETHRVISSDYARFSAIDLKGGINKGASTVELAKIRLKALEKGFVEIDLRANKLYSDNGSSMNPLSYKAYLIVDPLPFVEIDELREFLNSTEEFEREISEFRELEEEYEKLMSYMANSTPPNEDFEVEENSSSKILNEETLIPKPKEIGIGLEDLILMAGTGAVFVLVSGRRKFSK
ncbi:MAG: hypothetical protein QFX37_06600 [Archaeoglobales archaeon]|nr:hypothetical protein [Archaeoglobales archaeon]